MAPKRSYPRHLWVTQTQRTKLEQCPLPAHPHCDTAGPPTVASKNKAAGKDRNAASIPSTVVDRPLDVAEDPEQIRLWQSHRKIMHMTRISPCATAAQQQNLPSSLTTAPLASFLKTDTDDSISASSESNIGVDTASEGGDAKGTAASGADMPEH